MTATSPPAARRRFRETTPETRGAAETGTAPVAAAVRFTPASCPCGSNENEITSTSMGSPFPRDIASAGTEKLAPPAPAAAASALATREAEYDNMGALPATPFSSGSAGASLAATSARIASAAASTDASASSSKNAASSDIFRGVTAADNAASMLTLPSSSSSSSEDPSSTAVWLISLTMPAIRPTTSARDPRVVSHGSATTRAATPETLVNKVVDAGTARFAETVTFTIASRSMARASADSALAASHASASTPLCNSARLRPSACRILKFSSCSHAKRTAFIAGSAPPALMSASAERTAATVASVAASSVASTGQVDATRASAAAEVAPSASRTCTATTTAPPSASRPPGSVPSYDARGLKSWSCCAGSAAEVPTTRAVNLYTRGALSSTQPAAVTVNTVESAVPDAGETATAPPDGGAFLRSVRNAAAAPLASNASSRKRYAYPAASASGASARYLVVSDVDAAKPAALRFTASAVPPASGVRVADHSRRRLEASASETTVAEMRATTPGFTAPPPGKGGAYTFGGTPFASGAAETTVIIVVTDALLAPLRAVSVNAYVWPSGPSEPRNVISETTACETRGSASLAPSVVRQSPTAGAVASHSHEKSHSYSVSWSGSTDAPASSVSGTFSASNASPPVTIASSAAAWT